jgi:hypothetical protein
MTIAEARRYAHKIVAVLIQSGDYAEFKKSPDWPRIDASLALILEQHQRFSPKSSDRPPRQPVIEDEPLPFDGGMRL